MKILSLFVAIMMIVISYLAPGKAQAQTTDDTVIKGDVHFLVGPSNEPIYPRGRGRHKHWYGGLDFAITKKRLTFFLNPNIAGAATFDNPDVFWFSTGLIVRVTNNVDLELLHNDAYALNARPVFDPQARRPTSSVNTTWLGARWYSDSPRVHYSVAFHEMLFGDEPLFFSYFTIPYARHHFEGELKVRVNKPLTLTVHPEFYLGNCGLAKNRTEIHLDAEWRLSAHLAIAAESRLIVNAGVPHGFLDGNGQPIHNHAGLFIGLKIPFGQ